MKENVFCAYYLAFFDTFHDGMEYTDDIEDANEGDIWEVQSFGNHLGAEEDVDFLGSKIAKSIAERVFSSCGIGVESGDFGGGEDFTDDGFGLFCSVTLKANSWIAAFRAEFWDDGLIAADVADQALVGAVVGQRDRAVVALDNVAAGWTLQRSRKAAAVEKEDDLLVGFESLVD